MQRTLTSADSTMLINTRVARPEAYMLAFEDDWNDSAVETIRRVASGSP